MDIGSTGLTGDIVGQRDTNRTLATATAHVKFQPRSHISRYRPVGITQHLERIAASLGGSTDQLWLDGQDDRLAQLRDIDLLGSAAITCNSIDGSALKLCRIGLSNHRHTTIICSLRRAERQPVGTTSDFPTGVTSDREYQLSTTHTKGQCVGTY